MTSSPSPFNSYSPSYCNEKVRIAYDSFSLVAGKGTIRLTKDTLKFVLYVPKLTYNLLSVSKLSNDSN